MEVAFKVIFIILTNFGKLGTIPSQYKIWIPFKSFEFVEIVVHNNQLHKSISNSYYFRNKYFLWATSLNPKFYIP
jgi:hypothetical protein